jgi:nitrile hydratase subunit alpha
MMSTAHDREHGHHHAPPAPRLEHQHTPEQTQQLDERVHKLEALLVAKGLVVPETLEAFASTYENDIGPMNGARVVARAWTDPAYKHRLLTNATAAIGELGIGGLQGEHMVVVENTSAVHNVVVCTLCSCYPWPVLGLPPTWYKMAPYRSRMVIDPRGVLQEFGLDLPDSVEVRVWDSSAEIRYMVLPERPPGTAHMSEPELAQLVTRDTMIGVARVEVTS